MTTFTPPVVPEFSRGDYTLDDPAERLFSYYPQQNTGTAVWRDPDGNYHQKLYPYEGGNTYRVFVNGVLTSQTEDDINESLANATEVYLGGHTYDISAATAFQLLAAGFGAGLNNGPVNINHWETTDVAKLSKEIMSVNPPDISASPTVDSLERACFRYESGTTPAVSNLREFWIHSDLSGTDFAASTILDPLAYGAGIGSGGINILPQLGLVLRRQVSGNTRTGITINNNIFGVLNFLNIGVWKADLDGTNFTHRELGMSIFSTRSFPFGMDVELEGNIVRVRTYRENEAPPLWTDPLYAATVNLDTDTSGSIIDIPTPVGEGGVGVISAHLGTDPLNEIRFRRTSWRRL